MSKYLRSLAFFSVFFSGLLFAQDQIPYEITDQTPIIFSDKENILVWEDPTGNSSIKEIVKRLSEFKPASEIKKIDADKTYWVSQKFINKLNFDENFFVDSGGNWTKTEHYSINKSGSITKLKPNGWFRGRYNYLVDRNPYKYSIDKYKTNSTLILLPKNEIIQLLSKLESTHFRTGKSFSLKIMESTSFSEIRRYGLYFQGILLGILLALGIFGWFSAYQNKDKTNLTYAIWITFAFFSSGFTYIHDGRTFPELFLNIEDVILFKDFTLSGIGNMFFGYGQAMMYVLFAKYFLGIKQYFPKINKLIYFYFGWSIIHGLFLFLPLSISTSLFWLIYSIPVFIILLFIYFAAFLRMKQGLKIAKFFMIAMLPYFFFRVIFLLGFAGISSPFNYVLPQSGFGYFFLNTSTAQLFALCTEALIMSLAVISRTRWLQEELSSSVQKQKELVENQNKVLEATVQERTQELEEQHKELDEAHQVVVGSVNYASRLQRGQLPRDVRLQGRFSSIDVIWEPRDIIGGDLWWISSSFNKNPFVLAVADCTGHGVPGAMLSLLVSNSLERIYSQNMEEDPATALMSLDHYVRTGLNQDRADSESDDGCDAFIMKIDKDKKIIDFAGAKLGLFHISNQGQATRYTTSRASLGYKDHILETDKPISKKINFQDGDLFAIVTDGFTDQIGGNGNVKTSFGYRRIEKLLIENLHSSANQITKCMKEEFKKWEGDQNRRDDLTAVVFYL